MNRLEQRQRRRRNSVLDGKEHIEGLPSETKSAVEKASAEDAKDCKSVLDGPACVKGVPESRGQKH
jgi:hypothetical protein